MTQTSKTQTPTNQRGCLGRAARLIGLFVALLAAFLLISVLYQQVAIRRDRASHPPPGQLVGVNGRHFHINCTGSGGPTVLIDAGNANFSLDWTHIQGEVDETTRVCTFDRAGYGWSDPGPQPRDASSVVEELHALLVAAGEAGPYVLVGHSLGGVHTRLFAARYPDETAAMVLIDTSTEIVYAAEFEETMATQTGFYQVMRLLTGFGLLRLFGPLLGEGLQPPMLNGLPADVRETYLLLTLNPTFFTTALAELDTLQTSMEQTEQALNGTTPLGDLPLIVLTAGQAEVASGPNPTQTKRVAAPEIQVEQQAKLATFSTRGEQRVIAESGHLMHLDAPQAVIGAIRDAIEMAADA